MDAVYPDMGAVAWSTTPKSVGTLLTDRAVTAIPVVIVSSVTWAIGQAVRSGNWPGGREPGYSCVPGRRSGRRGSGGVARGDLRRVP